MNGRFKSHPSFNPGKDYYQILGVDQQASKEEIDTAYKTLSLRSHPDISPEGAQLMQDLNEAHSVLSDADTRQRYDSSKRSESAKPRLTLVLTDAPAPQPSENSNMSIVVRTTVSFKEMVFAQKMSVETLIAWAKRNRLIAHEICDDDELTKYVTEYTSNHIADLAVAFKEIAIKTLTTNKFRNFKLSALLELRQKFGNEIFADALPDHCTRLATYDFLMTLQGNLAEQTETINQHLSIFSDSLDILQVGQDSLAIARFLCENSYWRINFIRFFATSLGMAHREIALWLLSDAESSQFIETKELIKLRNAHDDSIFNDACAEVKERWRDYPGQREKRELTHTRAPHARVPVPPPTANEEELKQYLLSQDISQLLYLGSRDDRYAWIMCTVPALIEKLDYLLYRLGVAHEEIAHFLMSPLNQAAWSAVRIFQDRLWLEHKSACMLAIQSADFKERVRGEGLSILANQHGEEVRAAIEADPDLRNKYRAYLRLANATQIGHSVLSHESSSISVVDEAGESYQMGQIFEKQRKWTIAWNYYYAAAQQGSVSGLAGMKRLINQFPEQYKFGYQVKIAAIYADPNNGLHNESLAKECIKTLVQTNKIPAPVLTNPHLFLLSPYFDKAGIALFDLAKKVPVVCDLIAKHDHLATLLKGRQFARLGRFDDVQAKCVSEPLTAYRRLIALADADPDTVIPATDDLISQLQLAGLNAAELSKLGRRFFPIALVIYDNDLIETPELFLVEIALQHEKVRTDTNLLIQLGQKLQAHSHNSLAALLYAKAAKNGSQEALDSLYKLNKKCDNHFAILLVICYSDRECRFAKKEKADWWIGRAKETDLKVVQDYFPLLISLSLPQYSRLWNEFSAPLAQLEILPAHFSLKRIFYQGLISVFMQKDVKSRLGDKLRGLLQYAEDIEVLSKVIMQRAKVNQVIALIDAKASEVVEDATLRNLSSRLKECCDQYYQQDLSAVSVNPYSLHSQLQGVIDQAKTSHPIYLHDDIKPALEKAFAGSPVEPDLSEGCWMTFRK